MSISATSVLAVVVAALGAICFGLAAVRQHSAVRTTLSEVEARGPATDASASATSSRSRVVTGLSRRLAPVVRVVRRPAWLLGASFITEGALPFAASDPLRVIPSLMAGSAVTGGLAMAFDVSLRAPHGGIFVLFAVDGVLWFLLSLVIGVLVSAACVIALKTVSGEQREVEELTPATV